jgi:hypothetical protein
MSEVFDMFAASPALRGCRLLDAVVCAGCGATLMRGELLVDDRRRTRMPHIVCVDCDLLDPVMATAA